MGFPVPRSDKPSPVEPYTSSVLANPFDVRAPIPVLVLFTSHGSTACPSISGLPIVVSFHPVTIFLNEVECRVLGSLVEKEITTPEYYPLSLNALVTACNQKSNREPAMNLDEAEVRHALHSLAGQSLLRSVSSADTPV